MRLSTHFGLSAQVEFFMSPEAGLTPSQGLIIIDLEAQNLISDLFYYALPNTYIFLDRTEPQLKERGSAGETTLLEIHLKSLEVTNMDSSTLAKDIFDTLQIICNSNPDCGVGFRKPEEPEGTLLCAIHYDMETFGPTVSKLAQLYHPNDEQVQMRADFLIHILERRGNGGQYIPAPKLN